MKKILAFALSAIVGISALSGTLGCRSKRENSSHWCNWNGWKRLGNCKGKS